MSNMLECFYPVTTQTHMGGVIGEEEAEQGNREDRDSCPARTWFSE